MPEYLSRSSLKKSWVWGVFVLQGIRSGVQTTNKKFFSIPEKDHWYIKRKDLRNGRKSRNSELSKELKRNSLNHLNAKKPYHDERAFLYALLRYNFCHTSHPDVQTYYYCFHLGNILFPNELRIIKLHSLVYTQKAAACVRYFLHYNLCPLCCLRSLGYSN